MATGSLESLISSIKKLPDLKQRSVGALLGATVADAAACPLHWVYNQETMDSTLSGSNEPEFWNESRNPFYKVQVGRPSAYNETALASLASLSNNNKVFNDVHICDSFREKFGAGTDYADAYERRNMSKHPETKGEWKGPIEGPWLQHAMRVLLENYDKGGVGELGNGEQVDQHDAFCAALPIIAMHAGKRGDEVWSEANKVVSLFTLSDAARDIFQFETILLNNFIMGKNESAMDEAESEVRAKCPEVLELIRAAEGTQELTYIEAVKKFGKSCSMPHSFQVALLTMLRTSSFVEAARLNITGGGCNCSRGNVIGACYGARYGIDSIPVQWLEKVQNIEKIIETITSVVE